MQHQKSRFEFSILPPVQVCASIRYILHPDRCQPSLADSRDHSDLVALKQAGREGEMTKEVGGWEWGGGGGWARLGEGKDSENKDASDPQVLKIFFFFFLILL